MLMRSGAAFDPMTKFRKLAASLLSDLRIKLMLNLVVVVANVFDKIPLGL